MKHLKFVFLLTIVFSVGCQNFQIQSRDQIKAKVKSANPIKAEAVETNNSNDKIDSTRSMEHEIEADKASEVAETSSTPDEAPQVHLPPLPKIAFILGPGGARTFAHIGFIKELHRRRAPVVAMAGVEMGALMASLYAWHGQVNDLDWQLNKIKNEFFLKKNLLGQSEKNPNPIEFQNYLNQVFGQQKLEDFKYQFACPSIQLQNQDAYIMSKGSVVNSLNYCLYSPPLFNASNGYTAGLMQVKQLAQFLRSRGASYVVFVNVLPSKGMSIRTNNMTEQIYWTQVSQMFYEKSNLGVDEIININFNNYALTDIEKREEIYQQSEKSAQNIVNQLLKKWSL